MSISAASHLSPSYPDRAARGTANRLRAWQQAALDEYMGREPRDFLAVATPGAGKTTFALRIATELLDRHVVNTITIVAPTEHLKTQWAEAAHRVGIRIDPNYSGAAGGTSRDYQGIAVTYAGVAAHPMLHRRRVEGRRTLVILDEIHHAGDSKSWGEAAYEAFEPAARRLALTGTPFRSDTNPIPFVTYAPDNEGIRRSIADYSYGYGSALSDGVVRPVVFMSYAGRMRWRTKAGDEIAMQLNEPMTNDAVKQAWRTALDPAGDWMPQVLRAADRRLREVRRGIPDAGGLVIATDQGAARAYADMLKDITGKRPMVVVSDDPSASANISEFTENDDRWMVAVRMVSEGVDVPRLAVGVYATAISTPLFFAQAVGRFVRARRHGETASVFVPSIPMLLEFASEMEKQRDHALDKPTQATTTEDVWGEEEALLAEANRTEKEQGYEEELFTFQALNSEAEFDRVLYDGAEFGLPADPGSREEAEYLGLPGLLEPEHIKVLLAKRQQMHLTSARKKALLRSQAEAIVGAEERPVMTRKQLLELRKELQGLVGAWHHKTGKPHGTIHGELRRTCGGPAVAQATATQLQKRIDMVRRWAAEGGH
ncbi:type III restriction protein res subunit [Catenulispora acidiphila DSM 44928]|uniref:Type III restriction protein res subunit n=1 Tax=Catenulispora acidiphila (strain DSM 44928 / JCM 14897 / NBRC 102108 / NRRL B-24433 / ID139908) TaxID=479433 RepID=C7QA02_CATAD|nr:DEAD/DEAH box helicase [Catenulispora acidiphila]ACU70400.1 type III restriction protein res subunit [Catenulispora acidiphila DSM 44928]